METFSKTFSLKLNKRLVDGTTHLVTECDQLNPGEYYIAKRTIKILLAMTQDTKIVSSEWIRQCLLKTKILDEGPFLAKGIKFNEEYLKFKPKKNSSKLFQGKKFHLKMNKNAVVSVNKLTQLIVNCGGTVTDALSQHTYSIIMTEPKKSQSKSPKAVSFMFVIDSVTRNELQNTSDY